MEGDFHAPDRSWRDKFRDAFRGLAMGLRDQSSFHFHLSAALVVIVAGTWLRLDRMQWSLLAICITVVLAAEMFNTALEHLAKAVDRSHNPHIANALDIGSAAVLVTAFGATLVGGLVLGFRLLDVL